MRRVLLVLLAAWSLTRPRVCRADDKEACAAAAERGQRLAATGGLVRAREQLVACAREDCPSVVREDCRRWLADVSARMPTVVFSARDSRAGRDLSDVRVSVDGVLSKERIDGAEFPLDPGPHRVRFERAGYEPSEEHVTVKAGVKAQLVATKLRPAEREVWTREIPPPASQHTGGWSYVALGVGAAAFATFGALEWKGQADYRELRDGCAKTQSCAEDDVDAARRTFIGAGVALGIGVVASAVAAWLLLSGSSRSAARASTSP